MTMRVDSDQLIAGACVVSHYAGHGVQFQDIPSTGTSGPPPLHIDGVAIGALPTDEMRWQILTWPTNGTLQPNENSTFIYTGADGVDSFDYRGFINGITYGDFTVTLITGVPAPVEEIDMTINAGVPTLGASSVIALSSSLIVSAGVPALSASAAMADGNSILLLAGVPTLSATAVMSGVNSFSLLAGIPIPAASCIMAGDAPAVISYAADAIALLPFKNRFAEV